MFYVWIVKTDYAVYISKEPVNYLGKCAGRYDDLEPAQAKAVERAKELDYKLWPYYGPGWNG
jgi:hypothetical protein